MPLYQMILGFISGIQPINNISLMIKSNELFDIHYILLNRMCRHKMISDKVDLADDFLFIKSIIILVASISTRTQTLFYCYY